MKGQNVDSLYIAEVGGKICDSGNLFAVVCIAGHQHKADPDRFLKVGQPLRELQDRTNLCSG